MTSRLRLHSVWLLAILIGAMALAQSNPVQPINQPLVAKNAATGGFSQPNSATQGKIVENYGKLPLSFEANSGQTDARVKFLSRGSGYTLFLTSDEAVFTLRGDKAKDAAAVVRGHLRSRPAKTTT
jgi:hypothetical protein